MNSRKWTIMLSATAGLLFVISCAHTDGQSHEQSLVQDSLLRKRVADSIMEKMVAEIRADTTGLYLAPVKVVRVELYEPTTAGKGIRIVYQNTSKKAIEAIRFKWYGENVFGEPADMGSETAPGYGSGFDDEPLEPGRSRTGEWNLSSKKANKNLKAWPYEVAFADGTKWLLGNLARYK